MDLNLAADTTNKIVTTIAVIIGGIWAYITSQVVLFGYRAELNISPSLEERAGSLYLSAFITFKNTGRSKIVLSEGQGVLKAMRIFGMVSQVNNPVDEVKWERLITVPILREQEWVEPNETVKDLAVYILPDSDGKDSGHVAYQLETVVGARRRGITRRGTRWQERAVVFRS